MHLLFLRPALLIAALLFPSLAVAQTAGTCAVGSAQRFLSDSNLLASLFNTGGLFFGGSTTAGNGYLVPKNTGNSPIFAAGVWVGGQVNGSVRAAASRYGNYMFSPGPLNADGTLPNPADCSAYDRIYVVGQQDMQAYASGMAPARDLADWPVGLGAPTVDATGTPVVADSATQVIDLMAGERPDLYGTQMAFWVMNDVGTPRTAAGQTEPLGVEVRVTAFVIATDDQIAGAREASFYRFTVLNRSASTIQEARLGVFTDPDLGDASDDYMGTDVDRGMAFVYNSNTADRQYGTPPAIGFDLLSGISSSVTFINNGPDGTRDPGLGTEYYNYMRGLWGDGTPITARGNGYQTAGDVTAFAYPGDPVTETFWSEVNVDGDGTDSPSGDRRAVPSADLGDLAPGESATVDLAILFAQGVNRFDSIRILRRISDTVQQAYADEALFRPSADLITLAAPSLSSPEDAADLVRADTLAFTWDAVEGATGYELRWDDRADGAFSNVRSVSVPAVRVAVRDLASAAGMRTVYWRVAATAPGARGTVSETRSVVVYRPGALTLSDGDPAYAEVSGPYGTDPCRSDARSTSGCDEGFGNPVYRSFGSDGSYYVSDAKDTEGSDATIGAYAPHDFEIRFTDAGSLGAYADQDGAVIPVPFEVWDVGPITPGESNDPTDDRQLIPLLFADNGGTCAFNPDEIPDGSGSIDRWVESDRVSAAYPATSYADFEDAFRSRVASSPETCYVASEVEIEMHLYPTSLPPPIQNLVFGSSPAGPTLPAPGTVIRLYTADPPFDVVFPIDTDDLPQPDELTISVSPNPSFARATLRYQLASPSDVELAVFDALGRRVAELVNARQPEGAHTAQLDARALPPGVYVARLRAGGETRSTRLTVVR